MNFYLNY